MTFSPASSPRKSFTRFPWQKGDITGHYVDHHSGEVRTVVYRMPPEMKKRGKTDHATQDEPPAKPPRPDVTQKGVAMIGDLRTDALHQALDNADIPDETLIGLLVLALGARNVSMHTTSSDYGNREAICKRISEGGVFSQTASERTTPGTVPGRTLRNEQQEWTMSG